MPKQSRKRKKKYAPTEGVRPQTEGAPTADERMEVFERLVDFVRKDSNKHRTNMGALRGALLNTLIRLCVELQIPPEEIEGSIGPCYRYHAAALEAGGPVLAFQPPTAH
ncbi:MAG: hypothetical protein IID31_10170 [Planctomycetes bacterium]|nr:hypothetical protein [Planctomycetota bacterium]